MRPPSPSGFRFRGPLVTSALATFAAVMLVSVAAHARRNGIITSDCTGCHGAEGASIEVTASPAAFAPGDDVTFTVVLRRLQGTAGVGGVSIGLPSVGEVHTISGEGLTLVADAGFTHSQPKQAANGAVTFRFGWRAPAEAGGVVIDVSGLAGNGDGRSAGDVAGTARFIAAFGCEPAVHYADLDRDGHGTELFLTSIGCAGVAPPLGYSTVADDCNDNDEVVFPGAVEKCNKKDDDCNGQTDENAELVELWPDADGDGYYAMKTGMSVIGCAGLKGYAADPGDCAPNDPAVHSGAAETCNLVDDNCDGRVDERVRPQCGEGRCRRESYDCTVEGCLPGAPVPERCNLLDDDCNGEVDDGELCAAGSACLVGKCVVTDGVAGAAGATGSGSGGGATAGGAGQGSASEGSGATGASGGMPPASGGSGNTASSGGNTGVGGAGLTPPPSTGGAGCALRTRGSGPGGLFAVLLGLLAILLFARRHRLP